MPVAHAPVAAAEVPVAGDVSAPSELPVELPPAVIAAEAQLVEKEASSELRADRRSSGESPATFDELAFLSSVVNTPMGNADVPAPSDRADERSRRDSFAQRGPEDEIVNLANSAGALLEGNAPTRTSPLAMNVTGNIPIVLKEKSSETAKSLKCGECGSMNYPTEWYCERCGAELASL